MESRQQLLDVVPQESFEDRVRASRRRCPARFAPETPKKSLLRGVFAGIFDKFPWISMDFHDFWMDFLAFRAVFGPSRGEGL